MSRTSSVPGESGDTALRAELAYRAERDLLPKGVYQEPAFYWLQQIVERRAGLTIMTVGSVSLATAVRPRLSYENDTRLVVVQFTAGQAEGFDAITAEMELHNGATAATRCFRSSCNAYEINEATGTLSDISLETPVTMPMDIYNANGGKTRAKVAGVLREIATAGPEELVDPAASSQAFDLFVALALEHHIDPGVVRQVSQARAAAL
jgi:hypothetical protein